MIEPGLAFVVGMGSGVVFTCIIFAGLFSERYQKDEG